ncbi:carbonic anhydrase [Thermospira aquatica]|uniref:Carbonic anhydrase n=1 Tax=Thermospira aquatica TaxID=2828656 RepID=A0AAX3BEX8_9SPIR|nr:carbonic anhydrase [Thermospira aquatica]URA10688.1 carbonic anhydrase [Thermospira aquatica]
MISYEQILENNKAWVTEKLQLDPDYFFKLSQGQSPGYLFIGCSDSRMPLNTFTKTSPGELFIHRNIANVVSESDPNFLAVLQYAVEVLHVPHIIIAGHYDCGGVKSVFYNQAYGHIKRWLSPIFHIYKKYARELENLSTDREKYDRLAELNVIEGVMKLSRHPLITKAREQGQSLQIHGWIIDIYTGIIKDLRVLG